MYELRCMVVRFADGTFFSGVKAKWVRKTKNFKDAKIVKGSLIERDRRYLERMEYELIDVVYKMVEQ